MKRVLLVVDVSNLYYCATNRFDGRKVDFNKLLQQAKAYGQLHRAIAYGAQMEDEATNFIRFLRKRGFEVKYKQPRVHGSSDGSEVRKADWDVGIAMDVVRMVDCVDVVVIASADGDLAELVKWVQEQGREVIVIGCEISRDLKLTANEFVEVDNLLMESNHESLADRNSEQSPHLGIRRAKAANSLPAPTPR